VLGLVGNDQAPADLSEPRGIEPNHAVSDQDDLIDSQVLQVAPAAVKSPDRNLWGEPSDLTFPGAKAPQPDQRALRLGQGGDLVGVEQRPVERELPAEFEQRFESEPGFGSACREPERPRHAA